MRNLLGFFLILITAFSAAAKTGFSFSCDHAGLGNGNISGVAVFVNGTHSLRNVVYTESSNEIRPIRASITVTSSLLSDDRLYLSGQFNDPTRGEIAVAMDVMGDLSNGQARGSMTIGNMIFPIANGNCSFR